MAPPKKTKPSSDSRLAVVEAELRGLRDQFSHELHTLRKKIDDDAVEVKSTLKEINDKMDTHIIGQGREVERLTAHSDTHFKNHDALQEQIKSMDSKIWKVSGAIASVAAAIIGGLLKLK